MGITPDATRVITDCDGYTPYSHFVAGYKDTLKLQKRGITLELFGSPS